MNKHTLTGRALLAFAIAAACASAVPASAAKIIVLDRTLPPEVKVVGTNFEVDEKLGGVRLAVDFYDESFDGNLSSQLFVVPGLTFDREHREVRYESEGSAVTCAQRKKILWGTAYPATDACRITVRSEPRIADAGFRERAVTGWVVELATNEPTEAAGQGR
jgi:phosphate-selective porin